MGILETVSAHYTSVCGAEIEVPEWGEKGPDGVVQPLVIRYDRPTLKQREILAKQKSEARGQAKLLIMCCKRTDGQPLFTDDIETLDTLCNKADAKVIGRIALEILGVEDPADAGN